MSVLQRSLGGLLCKAPLPMVNNTEASCILPGTSWRKVDPPKIGGTNGAQIAPKRAKQPAAKPVHPPLSMMGNMCSSSTLCGTERGSFTVSLFSSRGSQKNEGWLQCIDNSACLYRVPHNISIYACQYVSKSLWQPTASKRLAINCAHYAHQNRKFDWGMIVSPKNDDCTRG